MTTITDEWLKAHGFKWEDIPRAGRHWILWIGRAIPNCRYTQDSSDFGIEIAPRLLADDAPSMFFRADYAGRYSRFLYCRRLDGTEDVMRIIEAIIYPNKFEECFTRYGYLASPEQAARMKKEDEAFDVRMLKESESAWHGPDAEDQAVHVAQRKPEKAST